MSWKPTDKLMSTISHYAGFPATGVSLRQMVQFGEKPSTGAEHKWLGPAQYIDLF
jgi:pyruvate dehydrogenase kinase 2/3/4